MLNDESGQRAFYTVAALIAAYHRPTTTGPGQKPDEVPGTKAEDAESDQLLAADAGASQGVGPTRSTDNADRTQEPVSATEAAQQRRDRFGESLGSTYATAVAAGPRNGIRESAAETRLNLLSKQSTSGVHRHLPATARQLCDRNTPPDWARLLVDLRCWPHERRRVARRWLQDYHRSSTQPLSKHPAAQTTPRTTPTTPRTKPPAPDHMYAPPPNSQESPHDRHRHRPSRYPGAIPRHPCTTERPLRQSQSR